MPIPSGYRLRGLFYYGPGGGGPYAYDEVADSMVLVGGGGSGGGVVGPGTDFNSNGGPVSAAVQFGSQVDFDVAPTGPTATALNHLVNYQLLLDVFAGATRTAEAVAVDTTSANVSTYVPGATIGGVVVADQQRVLKNNGNSPTNGLYVVQAGGGVRAPELDVWSEAVRLVVLVANGGIYSSDASGVKTLGVDNLKFISTSQPAILAAGDQTGITGIKDLTLATLLVANPGVADNSSKATPTSLAQSLAALRVRQFTSTPTGGSNNDLAVSMYFPYWGIIWKNTSDTWAPISNETTWEDAPAAATCPGGEFLVTTVAGRDMYHPWWSDGTNLWPVGGSFEIKEHTQSATITGDGTTKYADTFQFPVGMVRDRTLLEVQQGWQMSVTASANRTIRTSLATSAGASDSQFLSMTSNTDRNIAQPKSVLMCIDSATQFWPDVGNNYLGGSAPVVAVSRSINVVTNNPLLRFGLTQAAVGDTATLDWWRVRVDYLRGA